MFCPRCDIEFVDSYKECRDCHVPLVRQRPKRIGRRIGKSLLGILLAVAASIVLLIAYIVIPRGIRFPAIILGAPAVAIVAGLFQAITGLTLFEVNHELPRMSFGRRFSIVAILLALLLAVLGGFIWFIAVTSGV